MWWVDTAEIEQTTTRGDTMRERRNKLSGMTRLCVVLVVMVSAATERQVKLGECSQCWRGDNMYVMRT